MEVRKTKQRKNLVEFFPSFTKKELPMRLLVKVTYLDGTMDIKECLDVSDICLDNVFEIKILRKEKV